MRVKGVVGILGILILLWGCGRAGQNNYSYSYHANLQAVYRGRKPLSLGSYSLATSERIQALNNYAECSLKPWIEVSHSQTGKCDGQLVEPPTPEPLQMSVDVALIKFRKDPLELPGLNDSYSIYLDDSQLGCFKGGPIEGYREANLNWEERENHMRQQIDQVGKFIAQFHVDTFGLIAREEYVPKEVALCSQLALGQPMLWQSDERRLFIGIPLVGLVDLEFEVLTSSDLLDLWHQGAHLEVSSQTKLVLQKVPDFQVQNNLDLEKLWPYNNPIGQFQNELRRLIWHSADNLSQRISKMRSLVSVDSNQSRDPVKNKPLPSNTARRLVLALKKLIDQETRTTGYMLDINDDNVLSWFDQWQGVFEGSDIERINRAIFFDSLSLIESFGRDRQDDPNLLATYRQSLRKKIGSRTLPTQL